MLQLYQKDAEIVNNGHKMLDKLIDKVDKFKTDRNNLPKDADGIYLIVEGRAKIVNRLKNFDYKGQSVVKGDFFGESKFIKSFGFSYFGDIIACKPDDQGEDSKQKSSKKNSIKQGTRRSTEKKSDGVEQIEFVPDYTTCLYMPAELLYLIPFYDFYEIREQLRKKKDLNAQMKQLASEQFREMIRRNRERDLQE